MNNHSNTISKKRTIAWVTPDYFVDCDFNPDILSGILKEFDIHWFILLPLFNARFKEDDFNGLKNIHGLNIEFIYSRHRQRDPRRLLFYFNIYRKTIRLKPVVIYLNCVPDPYFVPVLWLFNKNKTILCAHDGGVNGGFDFKLITTIAFGLSYRFFKYVCMFSKSQAEVFHSNFPGVNIFIINLALKSYGESTMPRPADEITFLSFGVINYSKNIESLINAACNIYEQGYHDFKISINGFCTNWDFYEAQIRYPQIFNCDIRIIGNSEIPNLFNTAHYFVQPYRHMSQSGAVKVAFNYNVPVIASNLPGFTDEIEDGVNGYLFDSDNDVKNLEDIMVKVITRHNSDYCKLLNQMAVYTDENYSSKTLSEKYLKMFNQIVDGPND